MGQERGVAEDTDALVRARKPAIMPKDKGGQENTYDLEKKACFLSDL